MAKGFSSSVHTNLDDFAGKIRDHDRKIKRIVLGEMIQAKSDVVDYAKKNAPWTDRTGNARAGLTSDVKILDGGNQFELILAHSMPYGIWLEVRFSGKYAIIMPSLNVIGLLLLQRIAESLKKAEAIS